jgi:membrane protein DedA with SNARE-associated domain
LFFYLRGKYLNTTAGNEIRYFTPEINLYNIEKFMPEEVVYYVVRYGYLAIFILVFLQEIGMPNPFPNELLLLFSGYLSFKGLLFLPLVIISAISADFIGTNILFFLFYKSGMFIIQRKPKWFPLSVAMMNRLKAKLSRGGQLSIFIFRLTPLTRGYTSVIAGLLQIKPKVFLPIALISAVTWSVIYVVTGYLIGTSWDRFIQNIGSFKYVLLAILAVILCVFFILSRIGHAKKIKEDVTAEEE